MVFPFREILEINLLSLGPMFCIEINGLTLFDMGFFEPSLMGRGHDAPHHNFVVVVPMVMKLGTDMKLGLHNGYKKVDDVTIITQ